MIHSAMRLASSLEEDKLLDVQGLLQRLEYRIAENRLFDHISNVRSNWRERLF